MRCLLKVVAAITVCAVLLSGLVAVLWFHSGLQTWAVQKVLASSEDPRLSVEAVRLRWGQVAVTGLEASSDEGWAMRFPALTIEFSPTSLLPGRRPVLHSIAADDIRGRRSVPPPSPGQPPSGPARVSPLEAIGGILALPFTAELPVELHHLQLAGTHECDLSGASRFHLRADDWLPGQAGTLTLEVNVLHQPDSGPRWQGDSRIQASITWDGAGRVAGIVLALRAEAEFAGLDATLPTLDPGTPVRLRTNLDLDLAKDHLRIESLAFDLTADAGTTLTALRLLQPFSLQFPSGAEAGAGSPAAELWHTNASGPLLETSIDLPVPLLVPFLPASHHFHGGTLEGSWSASWIDDRIQFTPARALRLHSLRIAPAENVPPVLVEAGAGVTGFLSAEGATLVLDAFHLDTPSGRIVEGKGRLTRGWRQPVGQEIEGEARLSLPALASFAAFGDLPEFTAGTISIGGTFDSRGDGVVGRFHATGAGIDGPRHPPEAPHSFEAALNLTQTRPLRWQIESVNDWRSPDGPGDLTLRASLDLPEGNPASLGAEISARRLPLAILLLAAAALPETDPSIPHAKPVWQGLVGQIRLHADRLSLADGIDLSDASGRLQIRPDTVALSEFRGDWGGATVNAEGHLRFDPDRPLSPYVLDGHARIHDIDTETLFSQLAPDRRPLIEGSLRGRATVQAEAPSPPALADTLQGRLVLESGEGVFRPGAALDPRLRQGLGLGLGIVGGLLGGDRSAGLTRALQAVEDLVVFFDEIPFEAFHFDATLSSDHSLQLDRFEIRDRHHAFSGRGQIGPLVSLTEWQGPLDLRFSAAFHPQSPAAARLESIGLLRTNPDAAGFRPGPEFRLGGTLANWNTNWGEVLGQALTTNLGRRLLPQDQDN